MTEQRERALIAATAEELEVYGDAEGPAALALARQIVRATAVAELLEEPAPVSV